MKGIYIIPFRRSTHHFTSKRKLIPKQHKCEGLRIIIKLTFARCVCTRKLLFLGDMIRNLRNSIAIQMFRDKKFLKAIAFVLLYHEITNSNICKDYSVSKLCALTGVHSSTIKKRLQTLKDRGLVKIEAGTLVFLSITSKHKERNKKLNNVSYKNLSEVEKSLYAILVCILQERKDFIHRAFLDAKYSTDYKTVKRAKQRIRKYARGEKFSEKGISYQTIAKKIGVSIKAAFDYVKFAVTNGFLTKFNHFKRTFYKNINYYPLEGYTFTTRNYAYNVGANTYVVAGASLPYYKVINNIEKGKREGRRVALLNLV